MSKDGADEQPVGPGPSVPVCGESESMGDMPVEIATTTESVDGEQEDINFKCSMVKNDENNGIISMVLMMMLMLVAIMILALAASPARLILNTKIHSNHLIQNYLKNV